VHATSPSSTALSQTPNCEVADTPVNETKLRAAQRARSSPTLDPTACVVSSPSLVPPTRLPDDAPLQVHEHGKLAEDVAQHVAQQTAMQHLATVMLATQQQVQAKATAARAASRLKAKAVANAANVAEQARGETTDLEHALSAFIRPAMRAAATPERGVIPICTPAAELAARAASRVARAQAENADADLRI